MHPPALDQFSFTMAGKPWFSHEWVLDLSMAALRSAFGLDALLLMKSLLVAATMLLVHKTATGSPLLRLGLSLWVFASLVPTFTPRPWLVSFALFALLVKLWSMEGMSLRNRSLAAGVLLALWMNLHGMFVIGYVWLSLSLAGGLLRHLSNGLPKKGPLLAPLAAMALGTTGCLAHPQGFSVLVYPLKYQFSRITQGIAEWQPPSMGGAYGRFLLVSFVLMLLLLLRSPDRTSGIATLIGLSCLAFSARRNIPLLFIGMTPFLSSALAAAKASHGCPNPSRLHLFLRGRIENFNTVAGTRARSFYSLFILAALAAQLLVLSPGNQRFETARFDALFPVKAVAWLKRQPGVDRWRIFNEYRWGGFLIDAGYPTLRPFVDGRTDLYGVEMMDDYRKVAYLRPDMRTVLRKYRIDAFLLMRKSPLATSLTRDPAYRCVYRDGTAIVFRKST